VFGRRVSDEEWKTGVSRAADSIRETCDVFETTGKAVEVDPTRGWMTVAETLSLLNAYEERFRGAKSIYDGAGKPRSLDPVIVTAKRSLDAFFGLGQLAFYWGKLHYSDASGGPGQRALLETGFAQKAALTRVRNNGNKFAENALRAAKAGAAALELLSSEQYQATGPLLMELFVNSAGEPGSQVLRQRNAKLSQAAMIGSWCFSRAAILGMVVSRDADEFIAMVWDPSKADKFWDHVNDELHRIDSADLPAETGLAYMRMITEYSQLYGPDVLATAVAGGNLKKGLKKLVSLADSPVSVADARTGWSIDTAMGLGLGILRPDFVRARLEAEANPDRESWTRAHKAGLDIPPEPDALSADEQIESVVEICRLFFQEYYPQAKAKLDALPR
jgi:hypothetical protein